MLDFEALLRFAVEHGASDVHVKVGTRPRVRIDGVLREAPFDTVEPADTERVAGAILPAERVERFRAQAEADCVYGIVGLGRFRVSAFRQRGWVGLVLRRVLPGIPDFVALGLPPAMATLSDHDAGLVLVAGLAGSGKTSTLAAMVDHLNTTRACHVVTIEDPVEVLHADKRAIVDQRDVGTDTVSVLAALESAMRQDPDVIVLSEVPDHQTAWLALQAAERGHLVLAGMATAGVVDTVDRFVESFEPHRHGPVRALLAATLRGIVSQRLLPRAGGRGRVPAVEVLVTNARVVERIGEPGRTAELDAEMRDGELYGMQTLDQAIVGLYRNGLVNRADAVAAAVLPSEMRFALDRADFDRAQTAATQPPPSAGVLGG